MPDLLMPALGADMETAKVVAWLVRPGDRVKRGDMVAVVETHKGAIDVECFLDGVIDHLTPTGQLLPVGAVIAKVHGDCDASPFATALPPASAFSAKAIQNLPTPIASQTATFKTTTGTQPPTQQPARSGHREPPAPGTATRVKVSPAARQLAQQLGMPCDGLIGSGADGAITRVDLERAAASRIEATPQQGAGGRFDPLQMREAIATTMSRSKREIPHYYLGTTIDLSTAQAWLSEWNAEREPADRLLPAILLLKATAIAVARVATFNGHFVDGIYRPSASVHVGWAISLRGGGLIAPALHDADQKPLTQLMVEMRDLVQRSRAGGLRSSELSDPTVTISNLGDRGAESIFGVVYPPQVALIGFGRIAQRPWVVDDEIKVRTLVNASLAADHRVSDGHQGSLLLSAIDRALQSPSTL
ncbi:MAG: 2-oxo acid dehydrogenase subunit E2 [Curvibacter sp.]|nr:2-oxo acid dehydrogenase subunit E2 [Curvibacter sp.]